MRVVFPKLITCCKQYDIFAVKWILNRLRSVIIIDSHAAVARVRVHDELEIWEDV